MIALRTVGVPASGRRNNSAVNAGERLSHHGPPVPQPIQQHTCTPVTLPQLGASRVVSHAAPVARHASLPALAEEAAAALQFIIVSTTTD